MGGWLDRNLATPQMTTPEIYADSAGRTSLARYPRVKKMSFG